MMFVPSLSTDPILRTQSARASEQDSVAGLPLGHFGALLVDVPWNFATYSDKGRDRSPDYRLISLREVMELPVASLAKPDCVLFHWGIWSMLPQALAVIEAWGFTYKSCAFVWMKPQIGLGFWTRQQSEFCLLATRGRPKRLHADVRQGIIAPRREHSRKPDEVAAQIKASVVPTSNCSHGARGRIGAAGAWKSASSTVRPHLPVLPLLPAPSLYRSRRAGFSL